jgi:hypothetical protein
MCEDNQPGADGGSPLLSRQLMSRAATRRSSAPVHQDEGRPFITEWSYGKSRSKAKEATGKN